MARLVVALLVVIVLSAAAGAEKRVALVIGNSAYMHAAELGNPRNDANDMAAALAALGVEVIKGLDLDKRKFEQEVRKFSAALSGADVGVFFYAGHGLQVNGNNYLVPVDAELSTADALEFEMIRLDLVQRIMENNAKTNILFLDACRNNPLSRNLARALGTRSASIGKGLAPAESGVGTLISFSTQPGNVALDGAGRNSPYTGPLVKRIGKAGEDVLAVLTDVRNDVLAATHETQVPWENHALRARFYFNGMPKPPASEASEAERTWPWIKETRNKAVLENFIKKYRESPYAGPALARLEELNAGQNPVEGGAPQLPEEIKRLLVDDPFFANVPAVRLKSIETETRASWIKANEKFNTRALFKPEQPGIIRKDKVEVLIRGSDLRDRRTGTSFVVANGLIGVTSKLVIGGTDNSGKPVDHIIITELQHLTDLQGSIFPAKVGKMFGYTAAVHVVSGNLNERSIERTTCAYTAQLEAKTFHPRLSGTAYVLKCVREFIEPSKPAEPPVGSIFVDSLGYFIGVDPVVPSEKAITFDVPGASSRSVLKAFTVGD